MEPFRTLRKQSATALAIGAVFVVICYFWVDRPVAFFVREHHINDSPILRELTEVPMLFNALAPVIAVLAVLRLAVGPLTKIERTAFAAAVSIMVGVAFEYYLKYLAGRYWPETWVENNPSLIGTGAYGFHPFHFGPWYGSFPSGHTMRTAAVLSVFAITYPVLQRLCVAGVVVIACSLVGMNYHFVGDTIGGGIIGWLVGAYTAALASVIPTRRAGMREHPEP